MKATLRSYAGENVFENSLVEVGEDYDLTKDPCHEDNQDQVPFSVGSNQMILVHDESFPGKRKLTVVANLTEVEPSNDEDAEVAGDYEVEIDSSGDDDIDAGRALDVFARTVPVACLDDFTFFVRDGARNLQENPNYKSYSYHDGVLVGRTKRQCGTCDRYNKKTGKCRDKGNRDTEIDMEPTDTCNWWSPADSISENNLEALEVIDKALRRSDDPKIDDVTMEHSQIILTLMDDKDRKSCWIIDALDLQPSDVPGEDG